MASSNASQTRRKWSAAKQQATEQGAAPDRLQLRSFVRASLRRYASGGG